MALINPHINFNGNAEEAFTFYKSVFGGEFAKGKCFFGISVEVNMRIDKCHNFIFEIYKYCKRF